MPMHAGTRREFIAASAATALTPPIPGRESEPDTPRLVGGPMIGHTTDATVRIWARSDRPCDLTVRVGTAADLDGAKASKAFRLTAESDYAGSAQVEKLKPATRYHYEVLLDGKSVLKRPLPQFRTLPVEGKPAEARVLFGGCIRFQVDPVQPLWDDMARLQPAAMIEMGDNVYADNYIGNEKLITEGNYAGNEKYLVKRPKGYRGRGDNYFFQRVYHRIQQTLPTYRRFTAGTPIYAVWDDHDSYGEGGTNRIPLARRRQAVQVHGENFANPYAGGGDKHPGIWCHFSVADVDFFLLDARTHRERGRHKERRFLGAAEEAWLKERLLKSRAAFKFLVCGSPWNNQPKGGTVLTADNYYGNFGDTLASYKWHRDELFKFIIANKIPGIVLLSGDRHRGEVVRVSPRGDDKNVFYDLSNCNVASRTQRAAGKVGEHGLVHCYSGRCFGALEIDTTRRPARVTYVIWGRRSRKKPAEPVYRFTLQATELLPRPVST